MTATYDSLLVLYSFLIATIASYFVLSVAQVIPQLEKSGSRMIWVGVGSLCMAVGIWSMHFIGMVAYKLPIQLIYDPVLTLASILPAIASSGLFLGILSQPENPQTVWQTRSLGAFVIGIGIATMHYTGMGAIVVTPPINYDPIMVIASIFVGIAVSFVGMTIVSMVRRIKTTGAKTIGARLIASVIMGLAIPVVHYTGMAAVSFDAACRPLMSMGFTPENLQFFVGITSVVVMGVGILLAGSKEVLQRREEVIADYRLANEALYHAATRDPLTDCHNRRYFEEVASSAIEHQRREHRPLALMMIDIDHFKRVNDTHGHAAGDKALRHVVGIVRGQLRSADLLARIGGEEFAVLVSDVAPDDVKLVADRIRDTLEVTPLQLEDKAIPLTVSIGVAWAKSPSVPSLEELMQQADTALYDAKRSGRNRCIMVEIKRGYVPTDSNTAIIGKTGLANSP